MELIRWLDNKRLIER